MSRALLVMANDDFRRRAINLVRSVPKDTRIEFKGPKRTIPQSDRMWAMLTEVASQVPWHGLKMSPEDWKLVFLDGLKRDLRLVPNLDGTGFVNLGRSSSDLSKEEMSDLIELIFEFGARNGVVFFEPERVA